MIYYTNFPEEISSKFRVIENTAVKLKSGKGANQAPCTLNQRGYMEIKEMINQMDSRLEEAGVPHLTTEESIVIPVKGTDALSDQPMDTKNRMRVIITEETLGSPKYGLIDRGKFAIMGADLETVLGQILRIRKRNNRPPVQRKPRKSRTPWREDVEQAYMDVVVAYKKLMNVRKALRNTEIPDKEYLLNAYEAAMRGIDQLETMLDETRKYG